MKNYHAELKIHNLNEMSDADISRMMTWLREISHSIYNEKGKVDKVYSLKLMK